MRFPSVVEWCCPSPSIFLPFGLCIVESSPIRYPVTTGCLGRPRCLGCSWRCRCSSAATCGCIVSRKCLSQRSATAAASQGASEKKRLSPAKHGHEVLVLGLGEKLAEPFGKVAHIFIQTYNGNWHRTPPWSQRVLFFSLIPHGVLSCHSPFQKCKHRGCNLMGQLESVAE